MATAPQAPTEIKIPCAQPITTRDGLVYAANLPKGSFMNNCFMEMTPEGPAAVKRPGTSVNRANTGTPQGLLQSVGSSWAINNDVLINTNTGTTVTIPSITVDLQQYSTLSDTPVGPPLLKSASSLWI